MAIRIGVIGTADIAKRKMIPAIKKSESFEYVGVAIANSKEWDKPHTEEEYNLILNGKKQKAQDFVNQFGGKVFSSYEELIKSSKIDAVYIPLPPALHYKWGKLALENGKHVLMEKPFTVNSIQTKELLEIAEAKNLAVIENYGFIYHNQFKTIRKIFESGEIGELREIKASFGFPHRDSSDFRYSKKYGGGALLDCGGYTVKAACAFMEEPEVVYSSLVTPPNYDVDLYGSVALKDKKSNITAILSFGMDNSYKCDFELWGNKGAVISKRAYTAPETYDSFLTVSSVNGKKDVSCGCDNQFSKILDKFYETITDSKTRIEISTQIHKQQEIIQNIFDKC